MAELSPKTKPTPRPTSKSRAAKLVLIRGEGKGARRIPYAAVLSALAVVAATTLIVSLGTRGPTLDVALQTLERLHGLYRQQGLGAYQLEKERLRTQIKTELERPDSDSEARNIAVYLFPELLPDDDFEKVEAISLWKPLESEIEQSPHSEESHRRFIELRAGIWNYENADRQQPQLSVAANQVIRLYETLSAPKKD